MTLKEKEEQCKVVEFKDSYDQTCILREASEKGYVWLGVEVEVWMYLNKAKVKLLRKLLLKFVKTGKL